jgi:hypothetical protein
MTTIIKYDDIWEINIIFDGSYSYILININFNSFQAMFDKRVLFDEHNDYNMKKKIAFFTNSKNIKIILQNISYHTKIH